MGTELQTTGATEAAAAMACSMPALTTNMRNVLAKANDAAAEFTAGEIALIEPLSRAVAPVSPADRGMVRKAITAVVAALPAQATDEFTGRLKLTTYYNMLEGCGEAAEQRASCRLRGHLARQGSRSGRQCAQSAARRRGRGRGVAW
jgi:hypothetical protein